MFGIFSENDCKRILASIQNSVAFIEFSPSGVIKTANKIFCDAMGYAIDEIRGNHHRMFVDKDYANSQEYKDFWLNLASGKPDSHEFLRFAKGGREVWIQATYSPVFDGNGNIVKIVKLASDITADKMKSLDHNGKINAISRSYAVIEFSNDGTILDANDLFLSAFGYNKEEIKGKHHRIFVDPAHAHSDEYKNFWKLLNSGEFISDEFQRIGKDGRHIWIQASYNPILDARNRVIKIVKYAQDVTGRVNAVARIGSALSSLATGNLAQRIDTAFIPSMEPLRADFNTSVLKLRDTVAGIVGTASEMHSGAREISTASDDLSRRTEQQAASLEQTAAALDEITATVNKTAEGAKQARDVVDTARTDAEKSGEIVRRAVDAMGRIETSSQKISQIIGVIDEIAFQTNLLALNAGVEAARAGDAGRGFAVVAQEVRALAQRSADAAREIKGLISTSTTEVGDGVKLVGETGKTLERIIAKVAEMNVVVKDIASSAQEQATALHQVNNAVNEMDQVTQRNAAMAEEAKAASQSLTQESDKLLEVIGQFQISSMAEDQRRAPSRNPAPRIVEEQGRSSQKPLREARPRHKLAMAGGARRSGGVSAHEPAGWEEF